MSIVKVILKRVNGRCELTNYLLESYFGVLFGRPLWKLRPNDRMVPCLCTPR